MLRINTVREDDKHCRLQLCGQFTSEYVAELEKALNSESAEHRAIAVDLTNVTLVDRQSMKFLCGARNENVSVENIPSYVKRWIQQELACSETASSDE